MLNNLLANAAACWQAGHGVHAPLPDAQCTLLVFVIYRTALISPHACVLSLQLEKSAT